AERREKEREKESEREILWNYTAAVSCNFSLRIKEYIWSVITKHFSGRICHPHPQEEMSQEHRQPKMPSTQGTAHTPSTRAHQRSTAQHSTAQHSTAQHSTAQHSTAQHSTAQHSTAQHSTAH